MITALCTRADTPYKTLGVDCFDAKRDAYSFRGSGPVIAHPPCRAWGKYHKWSKHTQREKELAPFCLDVVRRNGGVLEHPAYSSFWNYAQLPRPGELSFCQGRTFSINQWDFGHRALKPTWLYIVGYDPPPYTRRPIAKTLSVEMMCRREREHTPIELAKWLVSILSQPLLGVP